MQALGPSRVSKVLDTLRHGAVYTTDFSGMDFPKEALKIIAAALGRRESSPQLFRHVRSSDWGDLQLHVLNELSRRADHGGTPCVLGDLTDRCHNKAAAWLNEMSPDKGSSAQAAAAANTQIAEFFEQNKAWIFEKHRRVYCHAHGMLCPAYPGGVDELEPEPHCDARLWPMPTPKRLKSEGDSGKAAPCAVTRRLLKRLSSSSTPTVPRPWWSKERQRAADHQRPLTFNVVDQLGEAPRVCWLP